MKRFIEEQTLVNLADSIRAKSGGTEPLTIAEMIDTIDNFVLDGNAFTGVMGCQYVGAGDSGEYTLPAGTYNFSWFYFIRQYPISFSSQVMLYINGNLAYTCDITDIIFNPSSSYIENKNSGSTTITLTEESSIQFKFTNNSSAGSSDTHFAHCSMIRIGK